MSKKYLIIMIAACIVCLGAGIVIGTGLKENNLAATAAGTESEVESIWAQIVDMQDNIEDIEDKIGAKEYALQDITYIGVTAANARREVVKIVETGVSTSMPYAIYQKCIDVGVSVSQPGTALSISDWMALNTKLKSLVNTLQAKIDTANSELAVLYKEYQNALEQLEDLMQKLQDAGARYNRDNA